MPQPRAPRSTRYHRSRTSLTTVDNVLTLSTVGLAPGTTNMITDWAAYPGVGVSRLDGVEMAISGTESFNSSVTLGADRYAFGFGIYESTDNALPGCNTGTASRCSGASTDYAFDAVEIRETIGGPTIFRHVLHRHDPCAPPRCCVAAALRVGWAGLHGPTTQDALSDTLNAATVWQHDKLLQMARNETPPKRGS